MSNHIYIFFLLLIFLNYYKISALFPGASIEDGDYRHLYPLTCIKFNVPSDEIKSISYVLGSVENWEYPKDRLSIEFYVYDQTTNTALHRWKKEFNKLFHSIYINENVKNWRENSLISGRRNNCGRVLISNIGILLSEKALIQLSMIDSVIVSPLLFDGFRGITNAEVYGITDLSEEYLQLEDKFNLELNDVLIEPIYINLNKMDSSYLTFEKDNIRNVEIDSDETEVFLYSAKIMNIPLYLINNYHYGYFFDYKNLEKNEKEDLVNLFIANWISENGIYSLPTSKILKTSYSIPNKFSFDKIYLINLKRRNERMEKMNEILKTIGFMYERWEAVDGKNLNDEEISKKIKFLPNYIDPYHKRPMKKGEIGCFLSHYAIWEDVVKNNLNKVIVFEDDIRFSKNATGILRRLVSDLDTTKQKWDFIYFGRRKENPKAKEYFIPGHKHLSSVTYSYWTLGYALSKSGAEKLLAGNPLQKMMALDEYIPIMYNNHPFDEWKNHFPNRNLEAYTVYPLIVTPERYTNEPGYVSDTEDSIIVQKVDIVKEEL
uniref:Glycosyltransferase 25 family member n=1 Tax=Strongyloides papillosus TaxID=174720 RepID=A0A0N5BWU0_STREA